MSTFFYVPDDKGNIAVYGQCVDGKAPEAMKDAILTDKKAVRAWDGKLYFEGDEPTKSLEEQVQAAYDALDFNVEARLDAFAATRRYKDIYTAKAAKDSHIAKYAAEGQYCELMWGETYAKCEELLAEYLPDVLAGKRPIPTWKEIEAQLPPLVWPDEQAGAAE